MHNFFESFAQIGLPGGPGVSYRDEEKICVEQDGEDICFSHGELVFAVIW
jgi:hypothetical protein